MLVGEATRRATERTVAYEDAGSHELKGKVGLTQSGARSASSPAPRRTLKSVGLEAPFVGRDRELRQIKELSHASRGRGQRAPDLDHRHRRDRQVAAGLGVLQVLRRDRPDDVLAPRPLSLLRRGRHLLGARGHGADARADRRGRGAGPCARQAPRASSRSTSPTRTSGASLEPRLAHLLGLDEGAPATSARTSSPPGGCSSSGSPTSTRW